MTKTELLALLDEAQNHIIDYNHTGIDVREEMIKIGFMRTLISSGEIKTLTQLIAYILYVSNPIVKDKQ